MFCVHQGTLAGVCARGSLPKGRISISELVFQAKILVLKQRSFLGRQNSAGCDLSDFIAPLLGANHLSRCSFVFYFGPLLSLKLCYKACYIIRTQKKVRWAKSGWIFKLCWGWLPHKGKLLPRTLHPIGLPSHVNMPVEIFRGQVI